MSLSILILAAGQGTRMRSAQPKVLHPVAGRPMLEHVVDTARALKPRRIYVVYGHGAAAVHDRLGHLDVTWVEQAEQLGTAHAVQQVLPHLTDDDQRLLVLYGDVPLVTTQTLTPLVERADAETVAVLTVHLADPTGYGRILRTPGGNITGIVEHKDAGAEQRAIDEVNTGILAANAGALRRWLERVDNDNAQGEYYLTDVIAMAAGEGLNVVGIPAADAAEVMGVNDKVQLSGVERVFQRRQAEALMREGVTLLDPARFDLRGELQVGRDVVIDVNVVIEGEVSLGDGVHVGPNSVIRDSRIGEGVQVQASCVIEQADIGPHCRIGPFARIRPATRLAEHVHIGNFVEIKKSTIAAGSKVNHLSYIGDTRMGSDVNVGAGTITCNYDGANKHQTVIGDGAFIGSNTQLVAPVTIGRGATIGAGSTITRDAPENQLTLARGRQTTIEGWQRPKKGGE